MFMGPSSAKRHEDEPVLRSRVFLAGQATSMLGDGLAVLAVPLLVLQLTRSPVAAVLASLPRGVGYLAAGLLGRVTASWRVGGQAITLVGPSPLARWPDC
jgi:hypothetical protein